MDIDTFSRELKKDALLVLLEGPAEEDDDLELLTSSHDETTPR